MSDDGMNLRREVLGDTYVDRAEAGKDEFTAEWQDFFARYAWGDGVPAANSAFEVAQRVLGGGGGAAGGAEPDR